MRGVAAVACIVWFGEISSSLALLLCHFDMWLVRDAPQRASGKKVGITGLNVHIYIRTNSNRSPRVTRVAHHRQLVNSRLQPNFVSKMIASHPKNVSSVNGTNLHVGNSGGIAGNELTEHKTVECVTFASSDTSNKASRWRGGIPLRQRAAATASDCDDEKNEKLIHDARLV